MRTNEIISFHAFLTSLTDGFTVAYDSVDAFGRVEPIKIYKSTTRKIGVSFILAAMSDSDFDSMWLKINKLTTMIYPQFDAGKQITSDQNTFTIPFSQMMSAPPFVRMRIGDLISSNYSKFNLARLFGFDSNTSQLSGLKLDNTVSNDDEEFKKNLGDLIMKEKTRSGAEFELFRHDQFNGLVYLGGNPQPEKISSLLDVSLVTFKVARVVTSLDESIGVFAIGTIRVKKSVLKDMGVQNYSQYENKEFAIPLYLLQLAPEKEDQLYKQARNKTKKSQDSEYMSSVSKFMSDSSEGDSGNAISRSFKSSGGKGLGGFIESINFDWYDKVTWNASHEDKPEKNKAFYAYQGRRAPKMCKITISFSPIHDITPGLDHKGINRAPVYNVRKTNSLSRKYKDNT